MSRRDPFRFLVRRPVGLLMAFVTLVVVGVLSYSRIPLQLLPEGFTDDSVMVWVPNYGASARENEEKVARVIESQLRTLQGIERIRSWSYEDYVQLRVGFNASVDMELAKAEIRDRLERARPDLPDTADQIGMWSESGGSLPLAFFSVTHLGDGGETDFLIDEVGVPRLEAAEGVSRIQIWGALQDTVRIALNEDRVAAGSVDVMGLIGGLSTDNFAQPLGEVVDGSGRLILRADMRFRSPEEIAGYPIGNGLTVGDVAEVRRSKSVRDQITRVDGKYAYFGIAQKESQANVVEASRNFQAAIEALRADPEVAGKLDFVPFFVQGDMIQASLDQLIKTALQGGAFAALVLLLFLRRLRTTLCVALAIPFSTLLALAFEHATGGTFNVLTMVGITLAIGMLVDNAVVVVENIVRVRPEAGSDLEAAARGTREIALPVTLATLTTVVVFLPVIFMSDNPMVRLMLGGMGIPLCASLVASLFVAVVFLPVITARIMGERHPVVAAAVRPLGLALRAPARALALVVGAARLAWHGALSLAWRVEGPVLRLLAPLRWPLAVGLVAAGAWYQVQSAPEVALSPLLRGLPPGDAGGLPPVVGPRLVLGVVAALLLLLAVPRWRRRFDQRQGPARPARPVPAGHSIIDWLVASNRALVDWTLRHRLLAVGASALAFLSVQVPLSQLDIAAFTQGDGGNSVDFGVTFDTDFTLGEAQEELFVYERFLEANRERWGFDHWRNSFDERAADISFFFDAPIPPDQRQVILTELRRDLPRPAGHRVNFYGDSSVSDTSKTIESFTLYGTDSLELAELGEQARELLEAVPGLSGVQSDQGTAPDQVNVEIDRDLAVAKGMGSTEAIQSITWALRGTSLPRFQERGREIPLILELDEEDAPGLATLRDLPVYSVSGQVPLSSIADFSISKGSSRIYRNDGRISYTLTAEVEDPARRGDITARGYAALGTLEFPRGFGIDLGQSSRNRAEEEIRELTRAFYLSVVLVFLVMGILFESLMLPFSVLFTIPFAVMGAIWSMWILRAPMDPMGLIGLIILAGVVVNNGIVLIDRIHRLRDELPRREAVLAGCAQRVRPIVMTALTTVMGLLPMAIQEPPSGSIDYRAMGAIVIGGLLASTFFTLWVVPLAYTVIDDLSTAVRDTVARATAPRGGSSAAALRDVERG